MGRPRRHAGGDRLNDRHARKRGFRTRLSHTGRAGKRKHGFVNPPLLRGSTVLSPTVADRRAMAARRGERVLTYGFGGSETHWALEDVIAEVEGGTRCAIVCSGLAAVTTPLLAFLNAGDHCLMPDHVYGPARSFATGMLKRLGIETTFYHPEIDEAGIAALMRPNTRVVYVESPGSHTFEVQDVPAIARAAHASGAKVLMDNTWGIHHFQPFTHGVDVSIQAATKYPAGHSDVMIGAITVNSDADWQTLFATARGLGQYASPDDCWLTLRGMRTMGVRLAAQMDAGDRGRALAVERPEVARVLHPALPGAPGHESVAARFYRRMQPVRGRVQAGVFPGKHARVRRGAGTVRHRRVMGRLRKPGAADNRVYYPHGRQRQVRRPGGAAAYRAGGCGRSDRRSGAGAWGDARVWEVY